MITRKRYDWAAAVSIPLSTFLAIVMGLRFGTWQLIGLPLFLTIFWLLLRFSIPIAGEILYMPAPNTLLDDKTKTAPRLLFVMCIPIIPMVAFQVFGIDGPIARGIFLATAAICFAWFFYQPHKIDSRQNQIHELGANLAPGFWLEKTASQPAKLDPGTPRAEFRTEEV